MWNFKKRLCASVIVLIVVIISQVLLWKSSNPNKDKFTDAIPLDRDRRFLFKKLILDSVSDQNQLNNKNDNNEETKAKFEEGNLILSPHTYKEKTHDEREKIGIDIEFLLAPPKDTLKFVPPRYLPDYKNPCFPIHYREVLEYASTRASHRKAFKDFEVFTEQEKKYDRAVVCLPSFYLVGWPKCGTTELTRFIQKHQDVYQGMYEVHYWNRETTPLRYDHLHHYDLSLLQMATQMRMKSLNHTPVDKYTGELTFDVVNYPEIINGTNAYGKYRLIGDFTPTYAYGFGSQVPHKIQHMMPNAKIIFSLRDPADRTLSHINYVLKFIIGQKFMSNFNNDTEQMAQHIHEMFIQSIKDYQECISVYCENYCATKMPDNGDMFAQSVDTAVYKSLIISLYHVSIAKYMELFPPENLHIVDLGQFSNNQLQYMDETLFPFLGLEPYDKDLKDKLVDHFKTNANTNTKPLIKFLPETKDLLRDFFRTSQLKLFKLLNGREFSWFGEYGVS